MNRVRPIAPSALRFATISPLREHSRRTSGVFSWSFLLPVLHHYPLTRRRIFSAPYKVATNTTTEQTEATKKIDGKRIANEVLDGIKVKYETLKHKKPFTPRLLLMCVAPTPAVRSYMRQKELACIRVGFSSMVDMYPASVTEQAFLDNIRLRCADPAIDGIIVQLPLPAHISLTKVCMTLDPDKDVDGLHPCNQGLISLGKMDGLLPCTPRGIMEIFSRTGVNLDHKNCVIVGRSYLVGHPLMNIMKAMQEYKSGHGPTVTVVHKGTTNPSAYFRNADILISAAGHTHLIQKDDVKEGVVLIDVGINHIPDNSKASGYRMVGDISPEAYEKASLYTPVPGGVGPMTVASLVHNTLYCAAKKNRLLSE